MFTKYRTLKAVKRLIENEQNPTYNSIKGIYKKCPSERYLFALNEEKLLSYVNAIKETDSGKIVPYFIFGEKGPQYIEKFNLIIITSFLIPILAIIASILF